MATLVDTVLNPRAQLGADGGQMPYVTCCKAERDGLPETETERGTEMKTMTEIKAEFAAMTVAQLRDSARRDYPVNPRGLRKEALVQELAESVWAEYENGHSDEGHDADNADADCPICAEEGFLTEADDEAKETKAQATRRGGRTLIPGYTMNEAREAVASSLADIIAKRAPKAKGATTLEMVESLLMDAAESKTETGKNVVVDYGRVMSEYLRQDRRDRYGYMLVKLHQATGRQLDARGFDRKTGLAKEGQA